MICHNQLLLQQIREEFFKDRFEHSHFDLEEMKTYNQVFDLALLSLGEKEDEIQDFIDLTLRARAPLRKT